MYEVAQALYIQRVGCMDPAVLCQSLQAGSIQESFSRQQNTETCAAKAC